MANIIDTIKAAIQQYADSSGSLDLRRSLGNPDKADFQLRGERVSPGIAYGAGKFLEALITGIAAAPRYILTFGANNVYANYFLAPGYENNANASEIKFRFGIDLTIFEMRVRVITAPGSGKDASFTIRKNGEDTAATIKLSNNATYGSWSGSVEFSKENDISVICTTTAGMPTPTYSPRVVVSVFGK